MSIQNYDFIRLFKLFILFQALHLKFCSSSHTTLWFQNVSLSLSPHLLWGKQAAMSEAALCKWPCDKDLRPPANSQREIKTVNNQVSLTADPPIPVESCLIWLLSQLEVWQTSHVRPLVKTTKVNLKPTKIEVINICFKLLNFKQFFC